MTSSAAGSLFPPTLSPDAAALLREAAAGRLWFDARPDDDDLGAAFLYRAEGGGSHPTGLVHVQRANPAAVRELIDARQIGTSDEVVELRGPRHGEVIPACQWKTTGAGRMTLEALTPPPARNGGAFRVLPDGTTTGIVRDEYVRVYAALVIAAAVTSARSGTDGIRVESLAEIVDRSLLLMQSAAFSQGTFEAAVDLAEAYGAIERVGRFVTPGRAS